jgi:hypothetical protein
MSGTAPFVIKGSLSVTTDSALTGARKGLTDSTESTIFTFNTDTIKSCSINFAAFQTSAQNGSSDKSMFTRVDVVSDGTSVFLTEYGTVATDDEFITFDASISNGVVSVKATPSGGGATAEMYVESYNT